MRRGIFPKVCYPKARVSLGRRGPPFRPDVRRAAVVFMLEVVSIRLLGTLWQVAVGWHSNTPLRCACYGVGSEAPNAAWSPHCVDRAAATKAIIRKLNARTE